MIKNKKNKGLTTPIGKFLDNISYKKIGLILVLIIIGSALYFCIVPPEFGVGVEINFGDALYFSIISIATVGYGDLAPKGLGRCVSSVEVMSGLLLTAVFIGKVASERQSRLLLLLYTSENQRRLREFSEGLRQLNEAMKSAKDEGNFNTLRGLVTYTTTSLSSFKSFLVFHANHGDIARFGNVASLRRFYKSIIEIEATILSIYRSELLTIEIRRDISKLMSRANTIGLLMINFHEDDPKSEQLLQTIQQKKNDFDRVFRERDGEPLAGLKIPTEELLQKIRDVLPPPPWPKNIHKEVAVKLNLTNTLAHKGINTLVEKGEYPSQIRN